MDATAEETTNCRYCGKAVSRILVKRGKTEHPVCLPPKKACIQVDVDCHSCGAMTSVVQDTDGFSDLPNLLAPGAGTRRSQEYHGDLLP